MATQKTTIERLMAQWSAIDDIHTRPMMGEYCLYVAGKVVGGVYDERVLLKDTPAARALLPHAQRVTPYPGAKAMLWLEDTADVALAAQALHGIAADLPAPKPRRR